MSEKELQGKQYTVVRVIDQNIIVFDPSDERQQARRCVIDPFLKGLTVVPSEGCRHMLREHEKKDMPSTASLTNMLPRLKFTTIPQSTSSRASSVGLMRLFLHMVQQVLEKRSRCLATRAQEVALCPTLCTTYSK